MDTSPDQMKGDVTSNVRFHPTVIKIPKVRVAISDPPCPVGMSPLDPLIEKGGVPTSMGPGVVLKASPFYRQADTQTKCPTDLPDYLRTV